jgi:hypothetical protein
MYHLIQFLFGLFNNPFVFFFQGWYRQIPSLEIETERAINHMKNIKFGAICGFR